jgi:hypothetical protein
MNVTSFTSSSFWELFFGSRFISFQNVVKIGNYVIREIKTMICAPLETFSVFKLIEYSSAVYFPFLLLNYILYVSYAPYKSFIAEAKLHDSVTNLLIFLAIICIPYIILLMSLQKSLLLGLRGLLGSMFDAFIFSNSPPNNSIKYFLRIME